MVDKRGFSLTELMIAIVILAVVSVPIINNIRQSSTQSGKMGKKLMALEVAKNLFNHLELHYLNNKVALDSGPRSQNFSDISSLMTFMDIDFSRNTIKTSIVENYRTFQVSYLLETDSTSNGSTYPYSTRIMAVSIEVKWLEPDGPKGITYQGEIIK